MRTRIISFHNGNLNPELLRMQQAVFDYFDMPLEQIRTDLPHPEAIDHFLATEEWNSIVIVDADCIPLNRDIIYTAMTLAGRDSIVAPAQKASHIPGSQIYASPCFMVFSKSVFEVLGKPSFKATERGDVAEEISYAAREKGITLVLLMPTSVEVPLWPLTDKIKFGFGTTYHDSVYHAFESNANHKSTSRFIEKCQQLISSKV
jgi:hypothetical protein